MSPLIKSRDLRAKSLVLMEKMRAKNVEQQGLSGIQGQRPQQLRKKLTLLSKTYFSLLEKYGKTIKRVLIYDKECTL